MAELTNVLAVVSSITVGGVVYVRSTESAKAGDVLRIKYDSIYLTKGGYYTVVRLNSIDDPQIMDDDEDEYNVSGREYTVFKRQQTESDTVVYEGVTYSKAKRHAVAGERFLIVAATSNHDYENGDSFIADYVAEDGGISFTDNTDEGNTAYLREYVVLEPVTAPSSVAPTETVNHEGTTYNVVKRNITSSDALIVITDDGGVSYKTVGKVYEVINIDSDGDPEFIDNDGDEVYASSGDYAVLEAVPSPASRKAQVGDRIKVMVTAPNYGQYSVGDVGTVVEGSGWVPEDILVRFDNGSKKYVGPSASNSEYEIIEPIESKHAVIGDKIRITRYQYGGPVGTIGIVTISTEYSVRYAYSGMSNSKLASHDAYEIVAAPVEPSRLSIGSYVVITAGNNSKSKIDDIVKIITDDGSNIAPYGIEQLDGSDGGFKFGDNLRPATEAEVTKAMKPPIRPIVIGDTAKLIKLTPCTCGFFVGDTVQVANTSNRKYKLEIRNTRGNIGYCNAEHLERMESVVQSVWTKLGRKTSEYRKGDIVHFGSAIGVIEDNGGTLVGIRGFDGRYKSATKSATTLITPVESRLDIAV